jgi:hypothetical protein
MGEVSEGMSRARRAVRRICLVASAGCAVLALALPALAQDEGAAAAPAVWHGSAAARGLTAEVNRDALLPVPGALRFIALEGQSAYDTDNQTARASLLYPGEGVLQGPNLVCGTFGSAFPPEAKPLLDLCATYSYPLSVFANSTNPVVSSVGSEHLGKATDPISLDATTARAQATGELTSSDAVLSNLKVLGLPTFDVLPLLPIEELRLDPSVVSVEGGSARTSQRIDDGGVLVVQSSAVLTGVRLVGGLVDIGSIRSSSKITDDGKGHRTSDASFEATGVTVAGIPAQITGEGLVLGAPSGASGPLQQQLLSALQPLLDTLGIRISLLGTHESTDENGQAVAAAQGLLIEVSINAEGLPTVPGPRGDIELNGTYVGSIELGATEASGAASVFGDDVVPEDTGGGGADLTGGLPGDLGGGVDLGPTAPSLPEPTAVPPRSHVEPAAAVDLFGGRLELLYAAFALAVLGLCIAPRLAVPPRLPAPAHERRSQHAHRARSVHRPRR